nr:hypothetical protein [Tanacetum cinerariifolium]
NPHIYISCIKQFWNTAAVKRSGDVTRLQALVDRKKIVISEAVIHEILQLNDAEGVVCLPNEDIFTGLAQMGYEKPSTKLTFYKDAEVAESEGRHAAQQEDDSEVQEVVEVVTIAKLITKVVTATASQVSAASTTIPAAKPTIPAAALTVVAAYTRRRKGIEMDAEYARKLQEEIDRDHDGFNKDIDWDAAMDHVNQNSNNPQYIKRYQGMKKRPQTESEAHKNMMIYLKNTAGYKMDFFKGMTYAQICPIFQATFDENMRFLFKSREEMEEEDQEIIKSINETPAQKAAKRRKLSEEAQEAKDLRKRLEVVEDEDDNVFVEATLLAQKVPIMDYQIVLIDNNLDSRLSEQMKLINFISDEYLLLTLKTMFEEPDRQDAIWRNQKSVHGLALVKRWKLLTSCGVHVITLSTVQLFLLVERRYPLSRFTLEQLVNVTRLQVEEESEMSLELLRFTRQQLQEYQQG